VGRWAKGIADIEQLLADRHLERVSGARAASEPWFVKAKRRLATASAFVADDPESAFVLTYDAARFVGEGLLAQQGLRSTQTGGHLAVVVAMRAQFGGPFAKIDTLRRRRHELEYPAYPGEQIDPAVEERTLWRAREHRAALIDQHRQR